MDFSKDGANLHSNCGAYELLFWDCGTGKQLPGGATQFKDEDWATWTATLGWPVPIFYFFLANNLTSK